MRETMKEEYIAAKNHGNVITSLTEEIYQVIMEKKGKSTEKDHTAPAPAFSQHGKEADPEMPAEEEDDDDLFSNEMPAENRNYLELFREDLQKANLSPRTINRHVMNADLFLNDYLWDREEEKMEAGTGFINSFMGFFIEKCLWASQTSIRQTAASIKKFYKSMLARNLISAKDYQELTDSIKFFMDEWLEDLRRFDEDDDYYSW